MNEQIPQAFGVFRYLMFLMFSDTSCFMFSNTSRVWIVGSEGVRNAVLMALEAGILEVASLRNAREVS